MNLVWYTSESTVRPKELDLDSSPTTVYFRRNIHTEERTDPDTGETTTYFVYEEAKVAKTEYASHQAYTNQANIDFISMMTDVELEEV